jgi:cysteine desulfurase
MIYFDHNATTPIASEVQDAVIKSFSVYGNPSSLHEEGQKARSLLDQSRASVAKFIGAFPDEIIFTSGGTEANNIAILGNLKSGDIAAVSPIEHSSVMKPYEHLSANGVNVHYLKTDANGLVDINDIPDGVKLVSIMLANNDIGVIQNIKQASEIAHSKGAFFHTDAVQAAGKIPVDVKELGVDFLSLSAHKLYAPKGAGALYVRRGLKPSPVMFGGSQEKALRAGTESLPMIAGFAEACRLAEKVLKDDIERISQLRNEFERLITSKIENCEINGHEAPRVCNTSNITFKGLRGDTLIINLDLAGLSVSGGSACSSADFKPSHVLLAMHRTEEEARSSVRFSIGRSTTLEDIQKAAKIVTDTVEAMRKRTW